MAADGDAATPLPPARSSGPGTSSDGTANYRICMVCLGNICRSPMAEVVLRDELDKTGLSDRVTVESAGTGDWHLGDPMDPRSRAELAQHGYDGSRHIARQIGTAWMGEYDLFVAMDRKNLASLQRLAASAGVAADRIRMMRSFDPAAGPDAEVPDPYDGGPAEYAETFKLVYAAVQGLTGRLTELLGDPAGASQP